MLYMYTYYICVLLFSLYTIILVCTNPCENKSETTFSSLSDLDVYVGGGGGGGHPARARNIIYRAGKDSAMGHVKTHKWDGLGGFPSLTCTRVY